MQPEVRKGISDVFTSKPPFSSSVLTSTKRPFYAIFTHSYHAKNHHISLKNPIKPLKIKHFLELNQNHTSNKKFSPYKLSKIQSQNLKNTSKSILLLSNTNQNFTLLSKSKNLSYHKSHHDHYQNSNLFPIQKENI